MCSPLFLLGLASVAGVLLQPWWQPGALSCLWGAGALALVALSAARVSVFSSLAALWASAFLLGSGSLSLRDHGPVIQGRVALEGVVAGLRGQRAILILERMQDRPAEGRVRLRFSGTPPPQRARVALFGRSRPLVSRAIPGERNGFREAIAARVGSEVWVSQYAVIGPEPVSRRPFRGTRNEGLLQALALGDRSLLPEVQKEILHRTGTRHLLAISGLHVATLAVATSLVLSWFLRRVAVGGLGLWPRLLSAAGGLAVAVAYARMAGWPVSAERAVWMFLLGSIGVALGRGMRAWNALGAAGFAVALARPEEVGSLAFGLSFSAVMGLLIMARTLRPFRPANSVLGWCWNSLAATVGATLGTLPLVAWIFQELPLISPVANLVATPLIGGVVLPLALLGSLGLPGATAAADAVLGGSMAFLGELPSPMLDLAVGPGAACVVALGLLWHRRPSLCASLLLLGFGLHSRGRDMVITFLAVGQGDAALVELPHRRILVDGGPYERAVSDWLARRGIRQLDEVVLSHPHPDHMRGLPSVLRRMRVGALRVSRPPRLGEEAYAELWELAARQGVRILGPEDPGLEVLHPSREFLAADHGTNNESLVFLVRHGRSTVLFPGDVEEDAERVLAQKVPHLAWIKSPHHGSRTSSSVELLQALSPRGVIVSCGPENRFGHPAPEVMARYRGLSVYRTDSGSVQLWSNGRREQVRRWTPAGRWTAWSDATGTGLSRSRPAR